MTHQTEFALWADQSGIMRRTARRVARVVALAAAIFAIFALTACGPGTGGTGVGPTSGTFTSASSGTGWSPGAITGTVTGTVTGAAASAAGGGGYTLVLDPLAIRLDGACLAFRFDGAWIESAGEIRVTGGYRLAAPGGDLAQAPLQAATLIARAEGSGFIVTLLDEKGVLLLSFTTGAKVADGFAVVPPPACKSLPAAFKP